MGLVRVQIPSSTTNLGPGFDALGVALNLFPLFYYRQYFSDLMEALKNYYGQLNSKRV